MVLGQSTALVSNNPFLSKGRPLNTFFPLVTFKVSNGIIGRHYITRNNECRGVWLGNNRNEAAELKC